MKLEGPQHQASVDDRLFHKFNLLFPSLLAKTQCCFMLESIFVVAIVSSLSRFLSCSEKGCGILTNVKKKKNQECLIGLDLSENQSIRGVCVMFEFRSLSVCLSVCLPV